MQSSSRPRACLYCDGRGGNCPECQPLPEVPEVEEVAPSPRFQWLGNATKRSLWRVDPEEGAVQLGWIAEYAGSWSAYLPPFVHDGEPVRLRTGGDESAAGRALCAHLRVGAVPLPCEVEDPADESGWGEP